MCRIPHGAVDDHGRFEVFERVVVRRVPVGTAQDFEDRVDLPFEIDVHAIERRMMDFRRLSRFDVDDAEFFGNPDSGVVAGVDRSAEGAR